VLSNHQLAESAKVVSASVLLGAKVADDQTIVALRHVN
jgi:hypothetical protein